MVVVELNLGKGLYTLDELFTEEELQENLENKFERVCPLEGEAESDLFIITE